MNRQVFTSNLWQFLLALGFCLPVALQADTHRDAMQWVQKMSLAMQEQSYRGRFVFSHNHQLESMSIIHVNDEQGRRERLISLNGEAREILRDNKNLTCIWPSSRQVVVDQASSRSNYSPLWIPEDVERLARFYEFSLAGEDRIADHEAIIVSIKPRDQFRYGMKLWIQKHNHLMLQSVLYDENGHSSEHIMFTELDLLTPQEQIELDVVPQIDKGYALIQSHANGQQGNELSADARWHLQSMPEGFWLENAFRKKMMESEQYTQHMILTDGMASVSIFIEPFSGDDLVGESSIGAVHAYGLQLQNHSVLAIGEVPPVTVRKIAESIVFRNDE